MLNEVQTSLIIKGNSLSDYQNSELKGVLEPIYLMSGSHIYVYYGLENIHISANFFEERHLTELIALIQDISNSNTPVITTDKTGNQDVTLFRADTILSHFTDFSDHQRLEIIEQVNTLEISIKLKERGLTPHSQTVLHP